MPAVTVAKAPADPPLGSAMAPQGSSPIEDEKAESVSETPTADREAVASSSGSGGSLLQNPKIMGMAAAAVVVVAGA